MTDFKELREALEAGPTDGPWTHAWGGGHVLIFQSGGGPTFASVPFDGMRDAEHAGANASYIAAANPAAIRSLLAELDEARRDAERWRTFIGMGYEIRAEWAANLSLAPVLTSWVDAAMKEQQP